MSAAPLFAAATPCRALLADADDAADCRRRCCRHHAIAMLPLFCHASALFLLIAAADAIMRACR